MGFRRVVLAGVFLLLACGCAGFFVPRAEKLESRIAVVEAAREQATTVEEREEYDAELGRLRAEYDRAVGGVLQEQANKQALLLALVGLGVGGLKLAAGAVK